MLIDPDDAVERLRDLHDSLVSIVEEARRTADYSHGHQRLTRWHERASAWIHEEVSPRLAKELRATGYTLQRSRDSFDYRAHEFSAFIRALITDIQDDPEHWEAYTDEEYDEAPSEGAAPRVFIGHGRSLHWHVIERFLEKQLGLSTVAFESEARAGMHNAEVVEQMLSESHIAVIVMCGEDVTESGIARARQNVVLEAGLSQSAFGRGRTILLVQRGIELPSNLDGLQVLHFSGDRIEECFEGVREVLGREGLIE